MIQINFQQPDNEANMRCECQQVVHQHPDLCVKLSQYRLIEIAGVDAEKYLQGN